MRATPSRHPLRTRAVLVAVLAEVVIIAAALGFAPELIDTVEVVAMSVLNVATLAGLVASGERAVTPMADPRNDRGAMLLPVDEVAATVSTVFAHDTPPRSVRAVLEAKEEGRRASARSSV